VASAEQATALPWEEPAAQGAAGEAVLPRAAGHVAGARQAAQHAEAAAEAEVQVAAVVPQPGAAARAGVEELPPEAVARDAAGVRLRAALPSAALPSATLSAGPWAFRQGQALPSARPAPQPAARSAHAMEYLRIARR
jgi:hypothetical protein